VIDPARFQELAHEAAMVALPLEPLLPRLAGAAVHAMVRAWAPRPDDWERVFVPPASAVVQAFYDPIWAAPHFDISIPADQTTVQTFAANPELLAVDNPISREFPAGYRHVVPWMQPGRVWVAWRHARPGGEAGAQLDGLVWVDDHWAFFPRPWRALAGLNASGVAEA
jgi:hypothetical protein